MSTTDALGAPTISVLMPVHNSKRYIGTAIDSVLAQSYTDFELLILDDGSTDGSSSILREYGSKDPRVHIWSRSNRGVVATRNELLAAARGRYLALLDSDDVSRPHRLAKQMKYLESHPECVAVGTRALLIDPSGMPIIESSNPTSHDEIDLAHLSSCESQIYNSSAMMVKEMVVKVGGYREVFQSAEDLDLFLRLAEIGRVANLPDVLVEYRHHLKSLCYREVVELRKNAIKAVCDARSRRGLKVPNETFLDYYGPETTSDVHRKWAWWALSAGNVSTARKHAMFAFIIQPLNLENFRVVACSIRGR